MDETDLHHLKPAPGDKGLRLFTWPRGAFYTKGVVVVLVILLFSAFLSLYERLVAPLFFFGGFTFVPRETALTEWLLILAAALVLPLRIDNATRLFLWCSFLFVLMPATVLSALQSSDRAALLMMYSGTLLVWLVVVATAGVRSGGIDWRRANLRKFAPTARIIVLIYGVVIAVAWALTGGVKTLDFSIVYDYRFDFNESVAFPLNYIIPITGGALSSLAVAYSLVARRYWMTGLLILFGMLLFGITTHKLFLFYPFLVISFFVLQKSRNGLQLVLLSLIIASTTAILTRDHELSLLGMLFANRGVFLPANIHYEYFREFSSIGFQYWAESKFGLGLVESRLAMPATNHIGEIMTGDARIGANTGWIANGYMNLGFPGIVIYSLILGVLLGFVDNIARRVDSVFVTSAVSVPILFLVTNGDLLVTLLTGGLIFSVLLLIIMPKLPLLRLEWRRGRHLSGEVPAGRVGG